MMVLFGYFLMAAIAGVAASAIIGFVLTNLLIGRFEKLIALSEFHQIRGNRSTSFNLD